MIHQLRRRHRVLWWVLALALPAAFVVSLLARPEPAVMDSLPADLTGYSTGSAADADGR